jgi:hypothetical protein
MGTLGVGPPVRRGAGLAMDGVLRAPAILDDTTAPDLRAARRAQHATRHPPLIDVAALMTGGTGRYRAYLSRPNGNPVRVRQSDGVHFMAYGALLFARAIANGVG